MVIQIGGIRGLHMSSKGYVTISLPKAISDAVDELIDELGYWPSRGSFVREATLEKIREERKLLKELREATGKPIERREEST